MKTSSQILFLSLNTFSGEGGIPQVCRNLTYSLSKICRDQEIKFCALALYDNKPVPGYINSVDFKGFKQAKFKFLTEILIRQRSSNTLILSHVNLLPFAFIVRKLNNKIPIVLLAHGVEIWRELSAWKQHFLRREIQIWSVSKFTKDKIIERHRVAPDRIQVLNNCMNPFFRIPIDFSKPEYLLKRYGLSEQKVILSMTRISCHDVQKGYDKIIKVMPYLLTKFPNLKYLLCGPQQEKESIRLRQLIQGLGLVNNVILTGFISEEELTDHYLSADLFVLPSKKEGFGIAFIESAACGRKTISGNADGSKEASLEGGLGITIDPDNCIALQEAIVNGLHEDTITSALYRQRLCLSHFGHEKYEQRISELLAYKSSQ